jgi:hypothetical protein
VIQTAASLDGRARLSWTNQWESSLPQWLHDSSALVQWVSRNGQRFARVYRLDSTQPELLPANRSAGAVPTQGHGLALIPFYETSDNQVEIGAFDLRSEKAALTVFGCLVPERLSQGDWVLFLSPDGRRLTWLAFFKQRWPRVRLHGRAPLFEFQARSVVSLWLSRLDGSGLERLGDFRPEQEIRLLNWSPDGDRLCYVFNGCLWSIPVPRR